MEMEKEMGIGKGYVINTTEKRKPWVGNRICEVYLGGRTCYPIHNEPILITSYIFSFSIGGFRHHFSSQSFLIQGADLSRHKVKHII